MNAIFVPSGDQDGSESWKLLFVSRTWLLPSAFMVMTSKLLCPGPLAAGNSVVW